MKVLVTGATGFVGGHLAAALVERGDEVVCLVRRPEAAAPLASRGARLAPGTLEDPASLAAAASGVGIVFHLAGLTAAPSEARFMAVNEEGTGRLIAAVRGAAPALHRFVHVSSLAAVGPAPRGALLDEATSPHPVTAYGRSKLAGEGVVRGAAGLPWIIVRPPVVYGPGDRELLRLFRITRWGVAPVFGLGAQELSVIYVRDLVEGLLATARSSGRTGETFHLAHPAIVRSRELARAVGRAARRGRAPLLLPVPARVAAPIVRAIGRRAAARGRLTVVSEDKMAEFLAPAWATSVAKAERELGWRAEHDLARGLAETATWYRRAGWLN